MSRYVDGFVFPIKKTKIAAYKKIAAKAAKLWIEHGALDYIETVGDDLKIPGMYSFTKLAKTRPGETVAFSFVIYKSRAHRDAVNKKVMSDPRLHTMCDVNNMPFDVKKMAYGGFQSVVDLSAKKKRRK
jgi:alkaline phosphatase